MDEKVKRDAGVLYAADDTLLQELLACKDLCHQYNQLLPSALSHKKELMEKILGRIKGSFLIQAPFWCDYGYNIEIGDNFYANHGCVILDTAKVRFGDNIFIGPDCGFYTAGHPIGALRRRQGLEYAHPIFVGDDVWFGGGVRVMPGVTIGSGVVIGSGSIVTRDIPDGVIAAGNPCRVLRPITEADEKTLYQF